MEYIFAHLERSAFDAASVELWEDLDDFHGEVREIALRRFLRCVRLRVGGEDF